MNKKILMPIAFVILLSLVVFVSARNTMVGSGFECDKTVENAGSVSLVSFSYPNVEIEVTANDYIGNSFLGFFHPMKLMTENLAAEIKVEAQTFTNPRTGEEITSNVYIGGPEHLNLILAKYYNYEKYPFTENLQFQVGGSYHYKIHFFLRAKTFADLFTAKCTQGTLGVIELCTDQPDGKCNSD